MSLDVTSKNKPLAPPNQDDDEVADADAPIVIVLIWWCQRLVLASHVYLAKPWLLSLVRLCLITES